MPTLPLFVLLILVLLVHCADALPTSSNKTKLTPMADQIFVFTPRELVFIFVPLFFIANSAEPKSCPPVRSFDRNSFTRRSRFGNGLARFFRLLGTDQFFFLNLDLLAHQDAHLMCLAVINERDFVT